MLAASADFTIGASANGRMLTGGDITLAQVSALFLDLERHTFAWNGSKTTSCQGTGSVAWTKTDSDTADLLAGSEWSLTDTNGTTQTVTDNGPLDADPADGALRVTGLQLGDYTLTETRAPEGYTLDPTAHPFTVTTEHTTIDLGPITNTKDSTTVVKKGDLATTGSNDAWLLGTASALLVLAGLLVLRRTRERV